MIHLAILILLKGAFSAAHPHSGHCKESHTSPGWPSTAEWSRLNCSLSGNLLAPKPPAAVCYPDSVDYDLEACTTVSSQWSTALFHDSDPVSLHQSNWQSDACVPPRFYNGTRACDRAPYAKYVVNASEAQHVVDAVRFANAHNLRVSVKNTGHDYFGRSTSPDFQIWTHYLRGITAHSSFQPQGCSDSSSYSAITVHSGNQYGEIYNFTAKNGVLVAGGADPSVGVGGHFTGGGHSPLGAVLGLAVDNALEMTVVKPNGELVTANACQNSDLFWAMRGGGGSTFGVLISLTERSFPDFPTVSVSLSFQSTKKEAEQNNNNNFYAVLADMHSELIKWSDDYVNGYYAWSDSSVIEGVTTGDVLVPPAPGNQPMTMLFNGWGHNQSMAQLNATMWPFAEKINQTEGISGLLNFTEVPRANDILSKVIYSGAGRNAILGSWLWDEPAMLDRDGLLVAFRALEPNGVRGVFTSGPAVRNASQIPFTSVTPAWRTTYQHTAAGIGWAYRNATAETTARQRQTEMTSVLQRHAPYMGSYLNEADRDQPDPGSAFWGENYPRLLKTKREMDPNAVFWCKPCVGFEDWQIDGQTGRLCRVLNN